MSDQGSPLDCPPMMTQEQFITRLSGYKTLDKKKETAIAWKIHNSCGEDQALIASAWKIVYDEINSKHINLYHFGLTNVNKAIATVINNKCAEKEGSIANCKECRNTGLILVYGTCGSMDDQGEFRSGGGLAFYPWKVQPDADYVQNFVFKCVCGRSAPTGLAWANADVVLGWLKYYGAYLKKKVGETTIRSHTQAHNCCVRKLLAEAGKTDVPQFERLVHQAELAGNHYPATEELMA